jgi:hypothetical protein
MDKRLVTVLGFAAMALVACATPPQSDQSATQSNAYSVPHEQVGDAGGAFSSVRGPHVPF